MDIEKDVEEHLLSTRHRRRVSGAVVYPFKYSMDMVTYDNWDRMFLERCCQGITLAPLAKPPSMVLDVGCGAGTWVIDAACKWENCTFYGFDIAQIQPNLSNLDKIPCYKRISSRVKWVHGNMLDGLPFEPETFDFVRMHDLGLAMPEDEWLYLLEDARRVLKPGGIVEIVEDDLIFPSKPPVRQSSSFERPSRSGVYSASSVTVVSRGSSTWSANSSEQQLPSALTPTSPTDTDHPQTLLHPNFFFEESEEEPPSDHSKLNACWDAMLTSKFLSPQLLSVLPFYLSSIFSDVQSHPTIKIPLPLPPSTLSSDPSLSPPDPKIVVDMRLSSVSSAESPTAQGGGTVRSRKSSVAPSRSPAPAPPLTPSWARMHLAKRVHIIRQSKEAMWAAWEELYGNDPSVPPVVKTSRAIKARRFAERASARPEFERAWAVWESDMESRISLRAAAVAHCGWTEPAKTSSSSVASKSSSRSGYDELDKSRSRSNSEETQQICRSIRGFVCYK